MHAARGTGGTEKLETLTLPATQDRRAAMMDSLEGRLEHKTANVRARQPSPTRAPLFGFRHRQPRVSVAGL